MFHYDEERAQRVIDFISELRHTKGKWAGMQWQWIPWQTALINKLFGMVDEKGYRQYRTCYCEIPKKQGKSEIGAAIALYLLIADDEYGAEVYCLGPHTQILYSDLTWREIGNVKVGDKLIGIDEYPLNHKTYRKMRDSYVLEKRVLKAPVLRIEFDNGQQIVCTENHKWLSRQKYGGTIEWRKTSKLKIGWRIRYLFPAWYEDCSKKAGYLAGLFDGEGYFHSPLAKRSAFRIGFTQNKGIVLDLTYNILKEKGYNPKPLRLQSDKSTYYTYISGLPDVMRFLGEIRPQRFIEKNHELWEGKVPNGGYLTIKNIEYIGESDVVDITTSIGTFIAEGLLSHNSAAGDREQASIVFNIAANMVEQDTTLENNLKVIRSTKRIVHYGKNSYYHALSSESYTKHGYNIHGCIFDELHAQPDRNLFDVLKDGAGDARTQPLMFIITTAGVHDVNSIAWEVHEYGRKINQGIIKDDRFLSIMYTLDMDADWEDEENWKKINPSLGYTVTIDKLRDAYVEVKNLPTKQNNFRRLRLNQWVSQTTRWLDVAFWDKCDSPLNKSKLKSLQCWGGLDIASTTDIAAFVLVFPRENGFFDILPFFWIPEEAMEIRSHRDKVPYDVWVREGYITSTPENYISIKHIQNKIEILNDIYNIRGIGFDEWGAIEISQNLDAMGLNVVKMRQGWKTMSPPTKEFQKLVMSRKIRHGGNPVLRWQFDNIAMKIDPAENIKIDKSKSTERVDGMVALVMGLDGAIRNVNDKSVYEDGGIFTIGKEEIKVEEE